MVLGSKDNVEDSASAENAKPNLSATQHFSVCCVYEECHDKLPLEDSYSGFHRRVAGRSPPMLLADYDEVDSRRSLQFSPSVTRGLTAYPTG